MSGRGTESYGQHGVTWVDRFGVWLSQRAIRRWLPAGNDLRVLELGCGYRATQLLALRDRTKEATGVDLKIAPELRSVPGMVFHEGPIDGLASPLSFDEPQQARDQPALNVGLRGHMHHEQPQPSIPHILHPALPQAERPVQVDEDHPD